MRYYYYEAGKGFESREIYRTMQGYMQQSTLDIAGSGTFDRRQVANQQLLDQGVILIPEKEIQYGKKKELERMPLSSNGTLKIWMS